MKVVLEDGTEFQALFSYVPQYTFTSGGDHYKFEGFVPADIPPTQLIQSNIIAPAQDATAATAQGATLATGEVLVSIGVPGAGEAMDWDTIISDAPMWQKGLAICSLGISVFTVGFGPNAGAFFRAGDDVARIGEDIITRAGGHVDDFRYMSKMDVTPPGVTQSKIVTQTAGEWPATGIARFDQLAEDSKYFSGWSANLERRGVTLDPRPLRAGNPANYNPVAKVLEYDPAQFKYIDLLHETRHIGQFERAAAAGLDLSSPFASKRLYGWLESGALDYEMRQATRFGFSEEYIDALQSVRSQVWPRSYQTKYNYSPTVKETLNQWWR